MAAIVSEQIKQQEFVPLDTRWQPITVVIDLPEGAYVDLFGKLSWNETPLSEGGKKKWARVRVSHAGNQYEYRNVRTGELLKKYWLANGLAMYSSAETLNRWTVDELKKGQFAHFAAIDWKSGTEDIPVQDVADWECRSATARKINQIGSQLKIGDIVRFSGQRDKRSARVIDTFSGEWIIGRKVVQSKLNPDQWVLTGDSSQNGIITVVEKLVDGKWQKIDKKLVA